jgi:hypothetical protein
MRRAARGKETSMPFLAFIIGIVIVLVLLGVAVFFGMIGGVKVGPNPDEGHKHTY